MEGGEEEGSTEEEWCREVAEEEEEEGGTGSGWSSAEELEEQEESSEEPVPTEEREPSGEGGNSWSDSGNSLSDAEEEELGEEAIQQFDPEKKLGRKKDRDFFRSFVFLTRPKLINDSAAADVVIRHWCNSDLAGSNFDDKRNGSTGRKRARVFEGSC